MVRVLEICDFLDENRRYSIKTTSIQFRVGVATVHRGFHKDLNMGKISAKFVSRVVSDEQKEIHVNNTRKMVELIISSPR